MFDGASRPGRQYTLCLHAGAGADRPAAGQPVRLHRQNQKRIGDGFPHLDTGYAAHHVVQAFQMLNIYRGEDVNAGLKQLLNILPALRMREPGALLCASSSIRIRAGRRARAASRSNSVTSRPRWLIRWGRLRRQPRQQRSSLCDRGFPPRR